MSRAFRWKGSTLAQVRPHIDFTKLKYVWRYSRLPLLSMRVTGDQPSSLTVWHVAVQSSLIESHSQCAWCSKKKGNKISANKSEELPGLCHKTSVISQHKFQEASKRNPWSTVPRSDNSHGELRHGFWWKRPREDMSFQTYFTSGRHRLLRLFRLWLDFTPCSASTLARTERSQGPWPVAVCTGSTSLSQISTWLNGVFLYVKPR